jgi:hypothetical protein
MPTAVEEGVAKAEEEPKFGAGNNGKLRKRPFDSGTGLEACAETF